MVHVKQLYNRLLEGITSQLDMVILNGDPERRYYGCCNLSFAFVEGESLLMALKNIALSSGRSVLFLSFGCLILVDSF